jgi:hypothetical protein
VASKPASKDHDKAFGGKQAEPFTKGKKEQEKAKPASSGKGRERQQTKEKK